MRLKYFTEAVDTTSPELAAADEFADYLIAERKALIMVETDFIHPDPCDGAWSGVPTGAKRND